MPELFNIKRSDFLYIDEIGQMELFSNKFRELARMYLDSENICLATMTSVYSDSFIEEIRCRDDVEIIEISPYNGEDVFHRVGRMVTKYK